MNTRHILTAALLVALFSAPAVAQTGHALNGVGAVNQSMAGAGTALPLDPSGAIHWNPASISGLETSEIQFSMEMMRPSLTLESTAFVPDGLGGFVPFSGSTEGTDGIFAIPSFGMVYKTDGPWTFGMGAYGISGFGVNYPGDAMNPITAPQSDGGFGSIYSQFGMLQVAPTFAYQVNDKWSIGFAPTINQAVLAVDPFPAATPGADGYPGANHTASAWGYGGQVGVYYMDDMSGISFGASYKSTQKFEDFEWNANESDDILSFGMDYPAMASFGVGFSGMEGWKFAADARYIDYANTNGFGDPSFDPASGDSVVDGFGWDSIMVFALGAQYEVDDCLSFRCGYAMNDNPVPSENSFFNVHAPGIVEQHASVGLTYCVGKDFYFDLTYRMAFENVLTGPLGGMYDPGDGGDDVPLGTDSTVSSTLSTDSLLIGFRVKF